MYFQRSFCREEENIERSIALSRALRSTPGRHPARAAQLNPACAYLRRQESADFLRAPLRVSVRPVGLIGSPRLGPRRQTPLGLATRTPGPETGDEQARADVLSAYRLAAAAFEELWAADQAAAAYYRAAVSLSRPEGGTGPPGRRDGAALPALGRRAQPAPRPAPVRAAGSADRPPRPDRRGVRVDLPGDRDPRVTLRRRLRRRRQGSAGRGGGGWYEAAADLALRSGAAASEALLLAQCARARILGESAPRDQPEGSIPPPAAAL